MQRDRCSPSGSYPHPHPGRVGPRARPCLSARCTFGCGYRCGGVAAFPHATAASLIAAMQRLVIDETPPLGSKCTPRSLRGGGISAAYAGGFGLPAIMRLSNHASATTVHRYYLDALLPASEAGRTLFRRFLAAGAATRGGGSA
jgi:integrase